jgi:hypothetical protein
MNNWKQYVKATHTLKATNTVTQLTDIINRDSITKVTLGQVRAVKAHLTMGHNVR